MPRKRRRRSGARSNLLWVLAAALVAGIFFAPEIGALLRPAAEAPRRAAPITERTVETGDDSREVVVSNARIVVEPHSRLRVPVPPPPDSTPCSVHLLSGSVLVEVGRRTPAAGFFVYTPQATAGVRGTRFRVRIRDGLVTEVEVEEGEVEVRGRLGEPLLLGPGGAARVAEGAPAEAVGTGGEAPEPAGAATGGLEPVDDRPGPLVPVPAGARTGGPKPSASEAAEPAADGTGRGPTEAAGVSADAGAGTGVAAEGGARRAEIEAEILGTYREAHGEAYREELLRSYRRVEGISAEAARRRTDLTETERRALDRAEAAAGAGGETDAALDRGYRTYDRRDTASLIDLHRRTEERP